MRMQLLIPTVAVVALGSASVTVALGAEAALNANIGRDIAANCANCHIADGRNHGAIPVIAGQEKAYLVQQLKDFRDGRRPSTIMQQLATGYTEAQIEAVAAYLSTQKPN
jgi:sulfide dehydrogenase cytochrome subunit